MQSSRKSPFPHSSPSPVCRSLDIYLYNCRARGLQLPNPLLCRSRLPRPTNHSHRALSLFRSKLPQGSFSDSKTNPQCFSAVLPNHHRLLAMERVCICTRLPSRCYPVRPSAQPRRITAPTAGLATAQPNGTASATTPRPRGPGASGNLPLAFPAPQHNTATRLQMAVRSFKQHTSPPTTARRRPREYLQPKMKVRTRPFPITHRYRNLAARPPHLCCTPPTPHERKTSGSPT